VNFRLSVHALEIAEEREILVEWISRAVLSRRRVANGSYSARTESARTVDDRIRRQAKSYTATSLSARRLILPERRPAIERITDDSVAGGIGIRLGVHYGRRGRTAERQHLSFGVCGA
jgi:hypothetical protein